MRIVTVRTESRGQVMELKGSENHIGLSVTDYVQYELEQIIKKQKESTYSELFTIQIHVDLGSEF